MEIKIGECTMTEKAIIDTVDALSTLATKLKPENLTVVLKLTDISVMLSTRTTSVDDLFAEEFTILDTQEIKINIRDNETK